jgi:hypothetical protein
MPIKFKGEIKMWSPFFFILVLFSGIALRPEKNSASVCSSAKENGEFFQFYPNPCLQQQLPPIGQLKRDRRARKTIEHPLLLAVPLPELSPREPMNSSFVILLHRLDTELPSESFIRGPPTVPCS